MKSSLAVLAVLVAVASVHADEVYLKGGGHVSGVIADESERSVDVEIGAGMVSVPRSQVERIVRSTSVLSTYQMRARSLNATDVVGWLELGAWAQRMELSTQAREAYGHVLEIEPSNPTAQRAMGNQLIGDRWLNRDDAMQAQGYIKHEGDWVTPEERDARIAERAASHREGLELARSRAAVAEAEAHAREADARARTAEAEARRAAVEADTAAVPVLVVPAGAYGYGYNGNGDYVGNGRRRHEHEREQERNRETWTDGDGRRPADTATPRPRDPRDSVPPPASGARAGRRSMPSTGAAGLSVAGYAAENAKDGE
jgi:hypothetical protein